MQGNKIQRQNPRPGTIFELGFWVFAFDLLNIVGVALIWQRFIPNNIWIAVAVGAVTSFVVTVVRWYDCDWRHLKLTRLLGFLAGWIVVVSLFWIATAGGIAVGYYQHSTDFEQFARLDFATVDTANSGQITSVQLNDVLRGYAGHLPEDVVVRMRNVHDNMDLVGRRVSLDAHRHPVFAVTKDELLSYRCLFLKDNAMWLHFVAPNDAAKYCA